jgi:hypothetical protein
MLEHRLTGTSTLENVTASAAGDVEARVAAAQRNGTAERQAPSPNGEHGANGTTSPHGAPAAGTRPAARPRKTPSPAASNGDKEPADSGRDAGGRFTKGNPGGPGNPFARQVAALRREALAAVTPDDVRAIVTKLVELARAGNVAAAKLVLVYTVGKPAQTANPDMLDVEEWDKFRKAAPMVNELSSLMVPDPSMLLAGLRAGVQSTTHECADFLGLVQAAPHKSPSALVRQWQKKKRRRQQALKQANGDGDSLRN